jgi:formate/nitrite transporter FocA (FNT family)
MADITKDDIAATKPDCAAGAGILAKARTVGINKTKLPLGKMFVLAILAGMFIGCGALFMLFVEDIKSERTL